MQLMSKASNSIIVDDSFTLDGAGGTIDLDMSTMPTEDFTVTLDECGWGSVLRAAIQ